MSGRGSMRGSVAVAIAAGVAGWALRFGLVEPFHWAERCDAAPWGSLACGVRTLVVQAFVEQRIGWASVLFGGFALVTRRRGLVLAGLACGAAGLWLYSAGVAATGLLLSALAGVPGRAALPWLKDVR